MAVRMEAALGSQAAAVAFFGELASCAEADGGVESVRAICAVNAGRLAQKYPVSLANGFDQLRERLPREVALSVEASGF